MRRLLVLAAVLVVSLSAVALAATRNGLAPKTPRKGAEVATGSQPTFKGKVTGAGPVWVYVSTSPKVNAKGVLRPGPNGMSQQAKRGKGAFTVKAKLYGYPEFWLNQPGTYYWQAHRIACAGSDRKDCLQEGPIVKFKVG